jgi:hypothetical protein
MVQEVWCVSRNNDMLNKRVFKRVMIELPEMESTKQFVEFVAFG